MIKNSLCLQPDDEVDPVKAYTQNGNILNVIIFMNNEEKVLCQANTLIAMFCQGSVTILCDLYMNLLQVDLKERKSKEAGEELCLDKSLAAW